MAKIRINKSSRYSKMIMENGKTVFCALILIGLFCTNASMAQTSSYSSHDNIESVVYQVENMKSEEIRTYNKWKNAGIPEQTCLAAINAARAQDNLIAAPGTIIDIHYLVHKDTVESLDGLNDISIDLINSTPKTIKEITFTFSFKGSGNKQLYDVKTGDEYCVLKYENLKGRAKSVQYKELTDGVMQSFHSLKFDNATYCKPFYNKMATSTHLKSINIKYDDNTTSNKVAIFYNGMHGDKSLYDDGPLQPITALLTKTREKDSPEENTIDNKVYDVVEEMPSFKGGPAALMKYLSDSIKYPIVAKENGIQGRVVVSFIVEKDGSISNVSVVRQVEPSLDMEAIRIVQSMPKWNPGKQKGKVIRTKYNVPVSFRLL